MESRQRAGSEIATGQNLSFDAKPGAEYTSLAVDHSVERDGNYPLKVGNIYLPVEVAVSESRSRAVGFPTSNNSATTLPMRSHAS